MRYRLREARMRAVMSQVDLAEASGVTRATIIGIERGNHVPRPSTLRKLAKALGVDPRELVIADEEPERPRAA